MQSNIILTRVLADRLADFTDEAVYVRECSTAWYHASSHATMLGPTSLFPNNLKVLSVDLNSPRFYFGSATKSVTMPALCQTMVTEVKIIFSAGVLADSYGVKSKAVVQAVLEHVEGTLRHIHLRQRPHPAWLLTKLCATGQLDASMLFSPEGMGCQDSEAIDPSIPNGDDASDAFLLARLNDRHEEALNGRRDHRDMYS